MTFVKSKRASHQPKKNASENESICLSRLHFSVVRSNDPCDENGVRAMTPDLISHESQLIDYLCSHPSLGAGADLSLSGHTYIMHTQTNTLARDQHQTTTSSLCPPSLHCTLYAPSNGGRRVGGCEFGLALCQNICPPAAGANANLSHPTRDSFYLFAGRALIKAASKYTRSPLISSPRRKMRSCCKI